jgi:hypothetical protein
MPLEETMRFIVWVVEPCAILAAIQLVPLRPSVIGEPKPHR